MKTFPILGSRNVQQVPWPLVEPARRQALRNHSQTLEQLAARGGLSPAELMGALDGQSYLEIYRVSVSLSERKEAELRLIAAVKRFSDLAGGESDGDAGSS